MSEPTHNERLHFNGVKIFSATMAADRDQLGEKITQWLSSHPLFKIVDTPAKMLELGVERRSLPLPGDYTLLLGRTLACNTTPEPLRTLLSRRAAHRLREPLASLGSAIQTKDPRAGEASSLQMSTGTQPPDTDRRSNPSSAATLPAAPNGLLWRTPRREPKFSDDRRSRRDSADARSEAWPATGNLSPERRRGGRGTERNLATRAFVP